MSNDEEGTPGLIVPSKEEKKQFKWSPDSEEGKIYEIYSDIESSDGKSIAAVMLLWHGLTKNADVLFMGLTAVAVIGFMAYKDVKSDVPYIAIMVVVVATMLAKVKVIGKKS